MKHFQKGFTLIELMIVVAIIGILAAIAIPSYQSYIARSQITEAMTLTTGIKTGLSEQYANNGRWPTALASINGTLSGKYVSNLTISTGAGATSSTLVISATFKSTDVASDLQGRVFAIGTNDGGSNWECGESGAPAAATSEFENFTNLLPGACR